MLGLSLLVDAIDHPKPSNSTEGSVLGPFHTQEAEHIDNGYKMSSDPNGEPCLVICSISDTAGTPISGVEVDIWETDSSGHYDVQYATPHGPDGRCVMTSDAQGHFWFRAIKPVSYPIPHDGPVGALLKLLHRHPWRPAHMHFMFEKEGWDHLITYGLLLALRFHLHRHRLSIEFSFADDDNNRALYIATDPYLLSDAVFGVKDSLIVSMKDASEVLSPAEIKFYSIEPEMQVLKHNFVLVTRKETEYLRNKNAIKEMDNVFPGKKIRFLDSLPVPDLD